MESHIPEYMVPSEVIYLDELPLNAGKKVDLQKLEKMYTEGINTTFKKRTRK